MQDTKIISAVILIFENGPLKFTITKIGVKIPQFWSNHFILMQNKIYQSTCRLLWLGA